MGTRRPPGSSPFPYTTLFRSRVSNRRIHLPEGLRTAKASRRTARRINHQRSLVDAFHVGATHRLDTCAPGCEDRKSTRLNSSHVSSSYAVFCLKKKIHVDGAR